MIYIGIDPGTKTGFAVWDSGDKRFDRVETMDFWQAHDELTIGAIDLVEDIVVVIEVPERFMYSGKRGNTRTLINIATKYGGTIREANLLADRLEALGFEVRRVAPSRSTGTKMKSDAFKALTGYAERTSEHGRDAAMLVFGL